MKKLLIFAIILTTFSVLPMVNEPEERGKLIEKYLKELLMIIKPGLESVVAGATVEPPYVIDLGEGNKAISILINKDNNKLFIGCSNGKIIIYDISDYSKIKQIQQLDYQSTINTMSISPCGKFLVIGANKGLAIKYEISDLNSPKRATFGTHGLDMPITASDVSPDGKYIVTGDRSSSLMIWDTDNYKNQTINHDKDQISKIIFCSNNLLIIQSSSTLSIWDISKVDEPKLVKKIKDVNGMNNSVVNTKRMFVAYNMKNAYDTVIYFLDNLENPKTIILRENSGDNLISSPCQGFIFAGSDDGTSTLRDIRNVENTNQQVYQEFDEPKLDNNEKFYSAFSHCGKYLVTSYGQQLHIRNMFKWIISDLSYNQIQLLVKLIEEKSENLLVLYESVKNNFTTNFNFYIKRYIRNRLIDHYVNGNAAQNQIVQVINDYLEIPEK